MSKHTPGPWKVGAASLTERGFAQFEIEPITMLCAHDARLIAAAPDLLVALKVARMLLAAAFHDLSTDEVGVKAVMFGINAAIDAATESAAEQTDQASDRVPVTGQTEKEGLRSASAAVPSHLRKQAI